jgi:hypothetical protein
MCYQLLIYGSVKNQEKFDNVMKANVVSITNLRQNPTVISIFVFFMTPRLQIDCQVRESLRHIVYSHAAFSEERRKQILLCAKGPDNIVRAREALRSNVASAIPLCSEKTHEKCEVTDSGMSAM